MKKKSIKQSSVKLNLTEKETADVDHALGILEKVTEADLKFAYSVLLELSIKTEAIENGNDHVMNYLSLEEWRRGYALKDKYETKH